MDPSTTIPEPLLGSEGQQCAECAAPLTVDQRYCLNCGRRRGAMRLPFGEVVAAQSAATVRPGAGVAPGERSPLVALAALIALLLALGIGVLLGRGTIADPGPVARAPNVTVAAAPANTAAVPASVVSDWPAGTEGFTVALRSLPATAATAQVAQAKQEATAKGASDIGALKSDEYPSLTPAEIVVYSGTYPTRAAATSARKGLLTAFPDAKVVQVASTAAGQATPAAKDPAATAPRDNAPSGSSGAPKSGLKIPDKLDTDGAPPPTDKKAPGAGGGEATEIG